MLGVTNSAANNIQPSRGVEPSSWQTTVNQAQTAPQSSWDKFVGLFKTPTRTDSAVVTAQIQFGADFHRQIRSLGQNLSPEACTRLEAAATTKFSAIMAATLNQARNRGGEVSEPVLRKAIIDASNLAGKAMEQLKMHAQVEALRANVQAAQGRQVNHGPQAIHYNKESGTVSVIRQASQIENLVFRGGGAKGVGTGPALIEMERAGMLSSLQRVSGTSVGGLVAICLASGHSAEQMQGRFGDMDMPKFKGKPENFEALYPTVQIEIGRGARMASNVSDKFGNHGGGALQILDQTSAGSVASYLQTNWRTEAFQAKLAAQPPEVALRLGQLLEQNFATDRTNQMITFRDLHILHTIDPSTFKELTLTGFERGETNATKYFDVNSTPDMPIALAGRISMSIPGVFGDVHYDMGDGPKVFQDGGAGNNLPSEVMHQGVTSSGNLGEAQATPEANAKTMLMVFAEGDSGQGRLQVAETISRTMATKGLTFDDVTAQVGKKLGKSKEWVMAACQGELQLTKKQADALGKIFGLNDKEKKSLSVGTKVYSTMHDGEPKAGGLIKSMKRYFTGLMSGGEGANIIDKQKTKDAGPNSFVVFHGDLGTLDFTANSDRREFAKLQAQLKALEQIDVRQNQAVLVEYGLDQALECFQSLNDAERAALVKEGPPEFPTDRNKVDAAQFQMALYEMAMAAASPLAIDAPVSAMPMSAANPLAYVLPPGALRV